MWKEAEESNGKKYFGPSINYKYNVLFFILVSFFILCVCKGYTKRLTKMLLKNFIWYINYTVFFFFLYVCSLFSYDRKRPFSPCQPLCKPSENIELNRHNRNRNMRIEKKGILVREKIGPPLAALPCGCLQLNMST